MHAVLVIAQSLLLIAVVLTAPHMSWPEARGLALLALVAGAVFGVIGLRNS